MKFHIQSTIFGQLVRSVTGNKFFQYPDEINPLLWKQAARESCSQRRRPTSHENSDGADTEPTNGEQDDSAPGHEIVNGGDGSDVLVVCWYGPDDEEVRFPLLTQNLQKSYVQPT